jgi:hypothetical protein
MPNKDQLSTVVSAFEHWLSNRSGRQLPTPIALREQAVTSLNNYSFSQITSYTNKLKFQLNFFLY